eukprot:338453-Pleurochrysis_carterae.AAC.2
MGASARGAAPPHPIRTLPTRGTPGPQRLDSRASAVLPVSSARRNAGVESNYRWKPSYYRAVPSACAGSCCQQLHCHVQRCCTVQS